MNFFIKLIFPISSKLYIIKIFTKVHFFRGKRNDYSDKKPLKNSFIIKFSDKKIPRAPAQGKIAICVIRSGLVFSDSDELQKSIYH